MVKSSRGGTVFGFSRAWRTVCCALCVFALATVASAQAPAHAAISADPGSSNDDDHDDWSDFDDFEGDDDFDFQDRDDEDHRDDDDRDNDRESDHSGRDNEGRDEESNSGTGNVSDNSGASHHGSDDRDGASQSIDDMLYAIDYDNDGAEYVSGELLFMGTRRDLNAAIRLGYRVLSTQPLLSGGLVARLAIPSNTPAEQARTTLAEAAPDSVVALNHIYRSAQTRSVVAVSRAQPRVSPPRGVIGVIDTGLDASTLPDPAALLSQRALGGMRPVAREHGAMVASIATTLGARVHLLDVFAQTDDGALAASAERVAAALDWMISNRIAVINVSAQGPDNAILAAMVERAVQRGHIIVAAAGNGGPAAGPAYPAAYDGVVAVTAIDDRYRAYIRANRGGYLDFAAPGVNVPVEVGGSTAEVSGTSFAAPYVAAAAAAELHEPSLSGARRVINLLRERAQDLGEPGHDDVFGWGALD
jgi:subtilisin family serine protease